MENNTHESSNCQPRSCHCRRTSRGIWRPTSESLLAKTESKILDCLKSEVETANIKLPQSNHILWTITLNKEKSNLPLVMVHGMGGGIGLWAQNLDVLAQNRPVYAFDLLGFGRSSRPKFGNTAERVENEFVESIEKWRQEMKLDKMILLGHSLGAYICSAYALRYPDKIQHLFLVDPWGFPELASSEYNEIPLRYRVVAKLASPFNPLAVVRAAGPLGPGLIKRFRGDLREKFSDLFDDDTILNYIYHCNAQRPSGESAFKCLSVSFGWAKNPMISRIADIDKTVPMTFIYGGETWMDTECGYRTKDLRSDSYVDVKIIRGAGHHVYADEANKFNNLMIRHLNDIDNKVDSLRTRESLEDQSISLEEDKHREQIPITQL